MFWLSFHPVHVSITSLDYVHASREMRGFVRLYMDDLLLDCQCGKDIGKLSAGNEESLLTLRNYLDEKLIIRINDKTITCKINNIEINDNEVDINLHYMSRGKPETIFVKNLIMTDIYKDQANMVIVKVNEFEEGVKLTPEVTEQTFKVN